MIGTKLNDRSDVILPRLDIFGGTIRRIDAHALDFGAVAIGIQIGNTAIAIHGLDTAENFAAALAEGIAKGRALVEETTP